MRDRLLSLKEQGYCVNIMMDNQALTFTASIFGSTRFGVIKAEDSDPAEALRRAEDQMPKYDDLEDILE